MDQPARVSIWLSLFISLVLLVLLPFFFAELMTASLAKLQVSKQTAGLLLFGIVFGSFINIPIMRVVHAESVPASPLAVFGLDQFFPQTRRVRRETIIAVNVGGGLIPVGLAVYELSYLASFGFGPLRNVVIATLINIAVCYLIARPVPGLGIAMPGFVSPLVALILALILSPSHAPPFAFVVGVLGPLVGADLLHLKDIAKIATTGVASIGGAGTFDGIVLSGILAAYLA
jgi:uncharacterized membrane protein